MSAPIADQLTTQEQLTSIAEIAHQVYGQPNVLPARMTYYARHADGTEAMCIVGALQYGLNDNKPINWNEVSDDIISDAALVADRLGIDEENIRLLERGFMRYAASEELRSMTINELSNPFFALGFTLAAYYLPK